MNNERAVLVDLTAPLAERERKQLPPPEGMAQFWPVAWFPDSTRLLFTGDDFEGLYIYSVDSGQAELLVEEGGVPFWLEPGRLIAYVYWPGGETSPELRSHDVVSGEVRTLDLGALADPITRDVIDAKLMVTPDAGTLVYMVRQTEGDIWLAELE